jgi:tRNA threonylcarbamoyladenosine biosynthesis protein TsaE
MIYEITTIDSDQTQKLAARLGKLLSGGEVIELISDLGGGKTTFVQGLVESLGYTGEVTSPTFTISHEYRISSDFVIHHYDLYRLAEGGIIGEELSEDIHSDDIVTMIEWAGAALEVLPSDRLQIEIQAVDEDTREIRFLSHGINSDKLLKGISV